MPTPKPRQKTSGPLRRLVDAVSGPRDEPSDGMPVATPSRVTGKARTTPVRSAVQSRTAAPAANQKTTSAPKRSAESKQGPARKATAIATRAMPKESVKKAAATKKPVAAKKVGAARKAPAVKR